MLPASLPNNPYVSDRQLSVTSRAIINDAQRQTEQMTAEPVSMRGGGEGGDICCGRKPPCVPRFPNIHMLLEQDRRLDCCYKIQLLTSVQFALVSPASNASNAAAKRLRA